MKITDIKTYFVEAIRRNWVFCEVETDAGITGVGEVTLPGFAKTVAAAVEELKRLVIGANPLEVERIWEMLYRRKFWRGPVFMTALSGIEIALWDIKGKELGVPLYKLFGGPSREKVKIYGNYWFLSAKETVSYAKTIDNYAESAVRAVEQGYQALKWSPFGAAAYTVTAREEEVIVECVKRVREAVGENIDLMVDAHGRFNLPTAIRIARRLKDYNLFFIEEPVPPENIEAMVQIRQSAQVPIATGERLLFRHQFTNLLNKFAVDYIQPDAIHCGGISEIRKIAAIAESYYTPVIPHNPNGPVSTAAMIHAAASISNFMMLEYIPVPQREEILVEPLILENGYFMLPTKPGLGIELNKKAIAKFPYQEKELDHYSDNRNIKL